MKPTKIRKRSLIMAMALAAVFALVAAWPCTIAEAGPTECGMIGTWYGDVDSPLKWLGVHTAGSSLTKGEMLLEWVRVSNELLIIYGTYPTVTRLSNGRGVWEQTVKGKYRYTWYAYGISTLDDLPVYSVRVSGLAENTDCDHVAISFTYEVFAGFVLPQAMSGFTPDLAIADYADQTRVPLTVVPFTP